MKFTYTKKDQKVQKYQEILDFGCLLEAVCIPKLRAPSSVKPRKPSGFERRRSIIDDNRELDRTLEYKYLDKYEHIGLPVEQHDDSSQEQTGVGMAPTFDTKRTSGLAPS